MEHVLQIIKNRKSIRKYTEKPIPKEIIDEIVEAGRWGPSISGFLGIQPWLFVVITNREIIGQISKIILEKSGESRAGVNILLSSSAKIINNAYAVILIYNSGETELLKNKYKEMYSNLKEIISHTELSAISASVQNMVLMAEQLGIGSCWLDTPLFCKKEISKLIGVDKELATILALGYPAETGSRSPRKPLSEVVRYLS